MPPWRTWSNAITLELFVVAAIHLPKAPGQVTKRERERERERESVTSPERGIHKEAQTQRLHGKRRHGWLFQRERRLLRRRGGREARGLRQRQRLQALLPGNQEVPHERRVRARAADRQRLRHVRHVHRLLDVVRPPEKAHFTLGHLDPQRRCYRTAPDEEALLEPSVLAPLSPSLAWASSHLRGSTLCRAQKESPPPASLLFTPSEPPM
ncbi:hypothetical protein AAFF_G00101220 [Aldrovandia affinis]|uniref:Uncharacterized protein n=1 Tax=Aldrovandia affinis TaxID=143900 RepID=A0AAD7RUY4_9TELE|nr:hypothetical protein AAFF_G00101220 [Aldrovandia affinis]